MLRACVVEHFRSDSIGQARNRSSIVDLGLRALRFQLVQNRRELCDLLLTKIELVRQKSQRASNAEAATAAVMITESAGPRVLGVLAQMIERIAAEGISSERMAVSVMTPMASAMSTTFVTGFGMIAV